MKKIILFSLLILFCLPVITSAQDNKSTKDPVGKWIYEGPAAPEGYTSGKLEFSVADKKYNAIWTFIGNEENKYSSENIKFRNDSLVFNVNVDGEDVAVALKIEENSKMTGKAIYSGGEVPMTLTRELKKE
jgi:hypothetical protein